MAQERPFRTFTKVGSDKVTCDRPCRKPPGANCRVTVDGRDHVCGDTGSPALPEHEAERHLVKYHRVCAV